MVGIECTERRKPCWGFAHTLTVANAQDTAELKDS